MIDNDDLRELYQDLILDHGKNPRNFRPLPEANCEALGHNPLCGDKLVLFLNVGADGRIADAAFQGEGCAISVASASMMTEMLKGKSAASAARLFEGFHAMCTGTDREADEAAAELEEDEADRLRALAGVRRYPVRVKCATLAWRTLQVALSPEGEKKAKTE
ncbi:MAG: SUF system NifU family Fe-S cluster assembly protein [Alphaproteobacteria bacterium]|nr:SUF system NifU family Fe-S cluster assembly protein [Alphaproteobacteria bacterium]